MLSMYIDNNESSPATWKPRHQRVLPVSQFHSRKKGGAKILGIYLAATDHGIYVGDQKIKRKPI